MLAFPTMLVEPAERAGIAVPPDAEDFNPADFAHFFVFLRMQLGAPMPRPGCHWDNAYVIAGIAPDQITKITPAQLIAMGFEAEYPTP